METATPTRSSLVTYQVEPFDTVFEEIQELLEQHWQEIALDKDRIKLAVDVDRYRELEDKNILHLVTVRDANLQKWAFDPGKLIGYHSCMIVPHLHYKNDLHALTDVFFIHPDYRKGRIGIELFKFVEQALKARGVRKICAPVKLHRDVGKLFEYLGWTEAERVFTKYIG